MASRTTSGTPPRTAPGRATPWILRSLPAACRRLALAAALLAGLAGLAAAPAQALTTPALLDTLQYSAFKYFWLEANPVNGLIKDRSASWSPCSIASAGFGLTAICIGIDRGWVTREAGRARVLATLNTFWNGPQGTDAAGTIGYQGFFYHFLDMNTATRVWDSELSSIDTALLLAGMLEARQYFDTADPLDVEVRTLVDNIYRRVNWEFMRNSGSALRMGWKPGTGFAGFGNWIGYNEAMIMYILALGSPTYPVPTTCWNVWVSGYNWATYYGQSYVVFPPLFGHQYSHCWIDFRYIQDPYMAFRGITYFENSRRATYAARSYCIDNPFGWVGYGENEWGLTASDDPWGYLAHGAPPAQNDNGTITPTAAASSIVFAPEIVIPTLHHFFDAYGPQLWGSYGFKDAFNRTQNWWATDVIGIDQGPIIIMIENYLTRSVWNRFMQNADIQAGLARAGFTRIVDVADRSDGAHEPLALGRSSPNPVQGAATIGFRLDQPGHVRLRLYDLRGRLVRTLVDGSRAAGEHTAVLDGNDLASGVYLYSLEANGRQVRRTCLVVD